MERSGKNISLDVKENFLRTFVFPVGELGHLRFDNSKEVTCDQPLLTIDRQMGLNIVHPDGKVISPATLFPLHPLRYQ